MRVEIADLSRLANWATMRAALWPRLSLAEHADELTTLLEDASADLASFMAVTTDGDVAGFAEIALRHDYVNGCETTPVAFLEGIYVSPEHQRTGAARMLVAAAENWARQAGCAELASDALLENRDSHAFHLAAGFAETERVVFYRKEIPAARSRGGDRE